MPLTMPYPDPTADAMLDHTYVWAAEVNLNFATQYGRIVYFVHRDEAAAYAGKAPLTTIAFDLTPTGTPEVKNEIGEVVEPAFPSFNEIMAGNQVAYMSLAQAVYMLILSRPQYSTAQVIVRPTVASSDPSSGDTVAPTDQVQATFNLDVIPGSIVFQLQDHTLAVIPTTMSYVDKVATFKAASPLAAGTYTATVSTAKTSTNDSMAAPVTWQFTVS